MCSGGSPGPWNNNLDTRSAMFRNNIDVQISNANSDSGEVVIAGYILLNDPDLTYQVTFSSAICEQLPHAPSLIWAYLNAHLMELILHIPQLVVRCSEIVIEQLNPNILVI